MHVQLAWRVFCPQHATRLDAAPVRSLFPRRSRRSHPRGRVPEFIHRHLQNSSAEAPHQRGLGREAIVGAIQTIENAITGALCGTIAIDRQHEQPQNLYAPTASPCALWR